MFYESPHEGGDVVDLEDVKGDWNETRDPSTHHGNAPLPHAGDAGGQHRVADNER